MASNAYLNLVGETQGHVDGSVTQAGRENSIMVFDVRHGVTSPRDAASGLATGHLHHAPIVVTKEVDRSSPLLHAILTNNENIAEWRLDFWRPSRSGKEFQFYTIELVDASIVSMELEMLNNKIPENIRLPEMERIAFAYQQITWTYQDGGITHTAQWETPIV